jgi:hypothetical protein
MFNSINTLPGLLDDVQDSCTQALDSLPCPPRRGRKVTTPLASLLLSKVRQKLVLFGSAASHLRQLGKSKLSDSSISRRLCQTSEEQLLKVSSVLLGRLATKSNNPAGYYGDYRLVGMDGTRFTLQNTAAINARIKKSVSNGYGNYDPSEEGFGRICACALVELGPHNPLAVRIGLENEQEMELALKMLPLLEASDLLIADRLFGVGYFLDEVKKSACGALLLKVPNSQTSREVKQLEDGSYLVEVDVRSRKRPATIIATHLVREIRYEITSTNARGERVSEQARLWTTLSDVSKYPARELIDLYHKRWEHELYYRELKQTLKKHKYLDSQLMETARVEIFAMVWASAMVARQRMHVSAKIPLDHGCDTPPPLWQISFTLVVRSVRTLLDLAPLVGEQLSIKQFKEMADTFARKAAQELSAKRRDRSCPRSVRQRLKHWPKLTRRTDAKTNIRITLR